MQDSGFKIRRIGDANEWREVVPVILVERNAGRAADKLLRRESLCLAAWRRRRFEEISKSRNAEQVAILRLNRQAVGNGWHTHVVPAHAIAQRKVALQTPLVLRK